MSTADAVILLAHLASTSSMAGLIWFVQRVHYPLFAHVGDSKFVSYESQHQSRTATVVGPIMAIEGLTTLAIFFTMRDLVGTSLPLVGGVLLAIALGSTIAVSVPAHTQLSRGFDGVALARLVSTNWIRTLAWTARTVVAALMMFEAIEIA